jgi:Xaa-Pro aminopeptidase
VETAGAQDLDLVILSDYRNIYYLTGHLRETELPQLLVVDTRTATTWLITDTSPTQGAADVVSIYESYSVEWPVSFAAITAKAAQALDLVLEGIVPPVKRIALEKSRLSATFSDVIARRCPSAEQMDATAMLARLRRAKRPDEIDTIRACISSIEAGYAAARRVIRPGATELDVFKEVHGEIVRHAGYNLKFEGDFACGTRAIKEGGSPLAKALQPGDLYILDIYPSFHGYHGDLCRTFAVSQPTDLQRQAWEVVCGALQLAEQLIRPGVRARDIWSRLREHIDTFECARGSFGHHAGHGIGIESQEPPWIIPGSDHVFEVGDVIALEPGCYSPALQGGVRLERDYVVHENGLQNLSSFPLEL